MFLTFVLFSLCEMALESPYQERVDQEKIENWDQAAIVKHFEAYGF